MQMEVNTCQPSCPWIAIIAKPEDPLPLDGQDTIEQKREMMRDEEPFRREPQGRAAPRLDLQNLARIAVSSEDPAYPRKAALEESSGGWKAADDGPQTFNLSFYEPQTIRRIHVEFHEPEANAHAGICAPLAG